MSYRGTTRGYGRAVTVLRPPTWLRGMVAVVGVCAAAFLVVGGVDDGGWVFPAALIGSVLVLAGTWRNDRLRVELGPQVVVVNFWRRHDIPWREVERFGFDGGAWVRRTDGRQHGITAFSPSPGAFSFVERRARHAVAVMERARRRLG